MDFLLPLELREFRDVLRKFLSANFGEQKVRSYVLPETGALKSVPAASDASWKQLCDLGALSASASEASGGLGMGLIAAVVVLEESSRALCPLPLFETLAAADLLSRAEALTPPGCRMLGKLVEGTQTTTCVSDVPMGPHSLNDLTVGMKSELKDAEKDEYVLTGELRLLPGLDRVDSIIVPARTPEGELGLFSVILGDEGRSIRTERVPTFDLLRSYSDVTLDQSPASRLASGPVQWEKFRLRLAILAAAELSGIAARVVELTAEYVKTREQFGRPIGSFQAIQHKLADMLLASEQAGSLTRFAAWCADNDEAQLPQAAIAAKAFASEAVPSLVEQAVQAHGGIGFTYEYHLHLFLRRAVVLSQSVFPRDECCERLAQAVVAGDSAGREG